MGTESPRGRASYRVRASDFRSPGWGGSFLITVAFSVTEIAAGARLLPGQSLRLPGLHRERHDMIDLGPDGDVLAHFIAVVAVGEAEDPSP
ncbi:hypothetical protein SAMN03097708_03296 [Thiohalomonas denitrificans]|uniref:Uncharacterized protein n=1 Tax=Thiohalomonas denitrificans TaxID=415747 RepID=A0A1G5R3F4_9GAMM|nr:hypothetical protein SAMN03097708_03296 [Thiohalomonas denitrificans]